MKRLKPLFSLFLVFVCLFALGSNSLTASAANGSAEVYFNPISVSLSEAKIAFNSLNTVWYEPASVSFSLTNTSSTDLRSRLYLTSSYNSTLLMWRVKFTPTQNFPDVFIKPYMQVSMQLSYIQYVGENYTPQTFTGALYITTPSDTIYEFPITNQSHSDPQSGVVTYGITISGIADTQDGFNLNECTYDFVCSGFSNPKTVDVIFNALDLTMFDSITDDTVDIVDSIELGFHNLQNKIEDKTQDILDNQDQNTQDIIDNDNANAEKTHGFLQNIVDGITGLPQKIWDLIEGGIKKLFVPSEEYIVGYKDKWDTLLSSRFGAVYEASDILINFGQRIKAADVSNTISVPLVSIPLPNNNKFSFGPYDVTIVPDKFGFLANTCKLITSVVAVFVLINALRKRWEEVMNAD